MSRVVVSTCNVASFPEGGGHFWVYMQYVQGLLAAGCDAVWLERLRPSGDERRDREVVRVFLERADAFGIRDRVLLYDEESSADPEGSRSFRGRSRQSAYELLGAADLLLNFQYDISGDLLALFPRTALVDIDPGLLQFWISVGQLSVADHDLYFTTGETVGTPGAKFSDCGLGWHHITPPISLDHWPYVYRPRGRAYTTVSGWWGGDGKGEWITDGRDVFFENNKRVTFLEFLELPERTGQVLELALAMGSGDPEGEESATESRWIPEGMDRRRATDYVGDAEDRRTLESWGWRVRDARSVAGDPLAYQRYIQGSRGEFSCVKPSCLFFENAWVSDRSICYLATGRPVVVQDTGPSRILPSGEGMFRFRTLEEAAEAFEIIDADYRRQSEAARALAETHFDSRRIVSDILDTALAAGPRS